MPRKPKSVEETAKELDATGNRLDPVRITLRDSRIARRSAQGWTNEQIATEAGISVRQVQRVLRGRGALAEKVLSMQPIDVVKMLATAALNDAEDCEDMALEWSDRNPNVALGAKGKAMQARRDLVELLRATNRLPRDLTYLGDLMDMREVAREMVEAIMALKDGDKTVDEVEATFRRVLGADQPELASGS